MEAHRKALKAMVEKLNNGKTALDKVNNKLLDKVLEERHRTQECRINWNTKCSAQERKIKEQDMEIRELKRKLMEAEERVLEVNMELCLINIELRIQELNDHLNPPAPANDDEVEKDPEEVIEVEENVDVEHN
ncbi:hypothetical protein ACH5RR_003722 [Cinchona calisaya]|uniref:Uncharacterized protein n=1 Tax=Cinchona calisaya TaxID=153742 RepID=A0ABD3AVP5_9GENT